MSSTHYFDIDVRADVRAVIRRRNQQNLTGVAFSWDGHEVYDLVCESEQDDPDAIAAEITDRLSFTIRTFFPDYRGRKWKYEGLGHQDDRVVHEAPVR